MMQVFGERVPRAVDPSHRIRVGHGTARARRDADGEARSRDIRYVCAPGNECEVCAIQGAVARATGPSCAAYFLCMMRS